MEIHIDAIRRDLQAASAALGDEEVVEQCGGWPTRSSPSLRLRVIDLLSEAALTLNGQLRDGHIEVRLAGRDPELVFVDEPDGAGRAAGARRRPERPDHASAAGGPEGRDRDRGVPRRSLHERLDRPCARARLEPRTARRSSNRLQGFARS